MTIKKFGRAAAVAAVAALALTSCASNEEPADTTSSAAGSDAPAASELSGELVGIGASSMGSAQEAWVAGFQTDNPGVTVNYDPQGSGAGRENFIAGASSFAGSDAYLSDEELTGSFASCVEGTTPIELPVYISPIAVIFNLEGVTELNLTASVIANIFNGTIISWDDPAIAELNEGVELPALNITAVHRSDDSGTTENFTDYLNKAAPEEWPDEASDAFPEYGGEGAQQTAGMSDTVSGGTGTIGYIDASRVGTLGVAKLGVGDTFVEFSPEAAANVVAGSPRVEGREANDIAVELARDTQEADEYPIVLISYVIACQEYADANDAALTKAYLAYIASEAGQAVAAEAASSAPLSPELSADVAAAIESIS